MKKNDINALIVYGLMMAIAIVTGLVFVRPTFSNSMSVPLNNGFAFILLTVLVSIIVNAVILELGHVIGAKIGGYTIYSTCVLWLSLRKRKGKFRFRLSNFDGLTGETKIAPKDVEKSNAKAYIYMPLLFLLLEVIGLIAIIAIAGAYEKTNNDWVWWKTASIVFMSAAFMIYIYDIFPAQLDNKNDGYLLGILSNQTNRIAYNNMLMSEYKLSMGEEVGEMPIYDKVTDFTSRINDITLYKRMENLDYEGAIEILEKTIACEKDVSDRVYYNAISNKVSLMILGGKLEEAKEYWISLKSDVKKFIRNHDNSPSTRACVLVSALVEGSEIETKKALDSADAVIRATPTNKRSVEDKLLNIAFEMVVKSCPEWDFRDYIDEPEEETDKPEEEAEKEEN